MDPSNEHSPHSDISTEGASRSLGESLYARGWKQGAICQGVEAEWGYRPKRVKADDQLVIISQDCDISATVDVEPYIEALVCHVEHDRQRLPGFTRTSSRNFVIDFDTGLVANAVKRVFLMKKSIPATDPSPWPGTPKHFDWFVQWLARRYDRPAVSDSLVDAFQRPVTHAYEEFTKSYPDLALAFNRAVRQLRVSFPASMTSPFLIHLTVLAVRESLSEHELDAIDRVKSVLRGCLDPNLVTLDTEAGFFTSRDMTLEHYEATWPLYLDSYTYGAEDEDGAPP